jgi:uncharacterized protein with von Willebrand factor type A (vWA) domain
MPIQLEFNLEDKPEVNHLMDLWAKTETSNQKRLRRLFAETSSMKKRLKVIEEYVESQNRDDSGCEFYEFDLFSYSEREA